MSIIWRILVRWEIKGLFFMFKMFIEYLLWVDVVLDVGNWINFILYCLLFFGEIEVELEYIVI